MSNLEFVTLDQDNYAEIIPGKIIRLHGTKYGKSFDVKFEVGDMAEYDSWNLVYLGEITKISKKTVCIQPKYDQRVRRLKIEQFFWKNWNFDLERIQKHNEETSMVI